MSRENWNFPPDAAGAAATLLQAAAHMERIGALAEAENFRIRAEAAGADATQQIAAEDATWPGGITYMDLP